MDLHRSTESSLASDCMHSITIDLWQFFIIICQYTKEITTSKKCKNGKRKIIDNLNVDEMANLGD